MNQLSNLYTWFNSIFFVCRQNVKQNEVLNILEYFVIVQVFMAKLLLHCLHGRACTGVCVFVVVDAPMKQTGVLSTRAYAGVYATTGFCRHQCTYLWLSSPQGVYMRSCICNFSVSVWGRWCKSSVGLYRALVAGVEGCFWQKKIQSCLSISSLFWRGVRVYVCLCVYTHAQAPTTRGVLGGEPRVQDRTHRETEESRWTKSRHDCIRTCYKVHMCIHMLGGGINSRRIEFFLLA